ncbi:MAG: hypothetical protein ACK5Q5_19565, partial [Planctomycetaceae bacterium]
FTSVADLTDQLRQFLEYDNRTMAHPFAWTYSGSPRAKRRRTDYTPPHRRTKFQTHVKLAKLTL